MGDLANSSVIAKKLTALRCSLYASPGYLEKFPERKHPNELTSLDCILLKKENGADDIWCFVKAQEQVVVKVNSKHLINNISMIKQLAVAGAGIANLPDAFTLNEYKTGSLVEVLDAWQLPKIAATAITFSRLVPARVKVLLDYLAKKLYNEK